MTDNITDDLRVAAGRVLSAARNPDLNRDGLDQALTDLAALFRVVDEVHSVLGDAGQALVVRSLVAGADPDLLIGRPFGATTVRKLAREAGVPPRRRGPRRASERPILSKTLAELQQQQQAS